MVRNPTQGPLEGSGIARTPPAAAPDTAAKRLDEVRRLLYGAGLDPRTHSAVEAMLAELAAANAERDAEIALLRAENARLEAALPAPRAGNARPGFGQRIACEFESGRHSTVA